LLIIYCGADVRNTTITEQGEESKKRREGERERRGARREEERGERSEEGEKKREEEGARGCIKMRSVCWLQCEAP